jgi:hypothetical protein
MPDRPPAAGRPADPAVADDDAPSAFPAEPWRLQGDAGGSLWAVPRAAVAGRLPQGVRPLGWGQRVLLVTAWVCYRGPDSVLSYRELLAAVPVRIGGRIGLSVAWMWVDDPVSALGGRVLWGMPKEMARFAVERDGEVRGCMSVGGAVVTCWRFSPARMLFGRWPAGFTTAQEVDGLLKLARVRARGRIGHARAAWRFAGNGALGFLQGCAPLLSFRLERMDLVFGGAGAAGTCGDEAFD